MLEKILSKAAIKSLSTIALSAGVSLFSCQVVIPPPQPPNEDQVIQQPYSTPNTGSDSNTSTGGSSGSSGVSQGGGSSSGSGTTTKTGRLWEGDDAFGDDCNPQKNYGSEWSFATGMQKRSDGSFCRYIGFVRFPIEYIPSGKKINHATLKLTTFPSANDLEGTTTINVVTNTHWSEGSLNHSTMPLTGSYVIAKGIHFGFRDIHTESFPVTDAIQHWVNGTLPNYGFLIKTRNLPGGGSEARFYSSEWGNHLQGPILEYEYEE